MRLALSTNWCNRRLARGEEIAEKALELGFDELELGFRTTHDQVPGFKAMLARIPVGSIHAFCPVPVGAPSGHPELYQLASFSKEARALARAHVVRNIRFAAEIGADTVVLHAGRVAFSSLFSVLDSSVLRDILALGKGKVDAPLYARVLRKARRIRQKRGAKLLDIFRRELDALIPTLQACRVTLALENLPYLEGFPDEAETAELVAAYADLPVRGWFDTGHARVRHQHGWTEWEVPAPETYARFAGMHLNDVTDLTDDHFAPGDGKVDFAALRPLAETVRHVVFEPGSAVEESSLARGVAHIRALWRL